MASSPAQPYRSISLFLPGFSHPAEIRFFSVLSYLSPRLCAKTRREVDVDNDG